MPVSQTITAIPEAGHRGIDAQDAFVAKQEAFQDALTNTAVSQLNTAFGQLNTLEENVNIKEQSVEQYLIDVENIKNSVEVMANVSAWVSGHLYSIAESAISLIDFRAYRATANTSGTTDPSLSSDWEIITAYDATKLPLSGGTMTGDLVLESYTETVYDLTGTEINPSNGTIQTSTKTATTTFTHTLASGQSVVLMLNSGANTINWFTTTWVDGTAPTLSPTGYNILTFWKVGTITYGMYGGVA